MNRVAPAESMQDRDLRAEIAMLRERGLLQTVSREVSVEFELSAVSKKLAHGPALLFENVKGFSFPVLVGTMNSMDKISLLLGVEKNEVVHRILWALDHPLQPRIVEHAPVQEVVLVGHEADLGKLPIPVHYEKDAGPYITGGVLIARDPETGVQNLSFNRLQVRGAKECSVCMLPRHLWKMYGEAEAAGRPLEVAVTFGLETPVRIAASTWGVSMPYEADELAFAGALKGSPIELVPCKTIDVLVPARAELVIEAEILPGIRKPEGPMMEFTGNYGDGWEFPVMRVKAITHRYGAIYQDMLVFTPEHHLLLGLSYEGMLWKAVRGVVPDVHAVHITPGGCGKFHAVVSIRKKHHGDGKDAIIAALTAVRDIKQVIVVDDDVDVFDPVDVEWAVATRFQADRDLVVISGAKGNELDPSQAERGITAKMGIDATKDLNRLERFAKGTVPGVDSIRPEDYLTDWGGESVG